LGAEKSLSTAQLKSQPKNVYNNVQDILITSPKSPKSNHTISNNNSHLNNVLNTETNPETAKTYPIIFSEAIASNASSKLNPAIVFMAIMA